MLETILAIVITSVYFTIGYKLSQLITVNQEQYNPVIICCWPLVFIFLGVMIIGSFIRDRIIKK